MKTYPSIPGPQRGFLGNADLHDIPFTCFDKLDGSNIRAEWSRKRGFFKFGRRRGLLDHTNPVLLKSQDLILDLYGDDLARVFRERRWEKATAFFEFYGPQSFAGFHEEDDEHTVTLIDLSVYKRGFLPPRDFLSAVGHLDIPNIVHRGTLDREFVDAVRQGEVEGITFEGLVCKGPLRKGRPIMFKVKSEAWFNRLRNLVGDDEAAFERLR